MHHSRAITEACVEAAAAIVRAKCVVAVTGAGVSAESGIPTFRGADGIWTKYPAEEYATLEAYLSDPHKVWRFWRELAETVRDCVPNPGHQALAALEQGGRLHALITQNVDNLHQAAGSKNVIEYHGNARKLVCLRCRNRRPLDPQHMGHLAPRCHHCEGLMKPAVVMFGEDIPRHAMLEADYWTQQCDVMIVVGTSAQVYPAAALPAMAKSRGALIVEANVEPTEFTWSTTDIFLEGPAGETLPRLAECLLR
jgi:NAD-dependent deacetylase